MQNEQSATHCYETFMAIRCALLSAPSERDIAILGRRTTFMLIGTIALVLAACAVLLTFLVLRLKQSWELQVAAERRHRQTLDHVGEHDSLTELPNRTHLRKRLPQLLLEAAESGRPLTLLYVDLDHFKHINESRCHGIGDQLIKIIAQRLQAATRPADIVIRSGGDEFVVIAPMLETTLGIRELATRLLATWPRAGSAERWHRLDDRKYRRRGLSARRHGRGGVAEARRYRVVSGQGARP